MEPSHSLGYPTMGFNLLGMYNWIWWLTISLSGTQEFQDSKHNEDVIMK